MYASRERNRIHARNTRERKRQQMDLMQKRIEQLYNEKSSLSKQLVDNTVAGILITLSSVNDKSIDKDNGAHLNDIMSDGMRSYEDIRARISHSLSDSEDVDSCSDLLNKEKSSCTSEELDIIRRERNRMHAKKTRLRKKKMIQEMESILVSLDAEVSALKSRLRKDGKCSTHSSSNDTSSKSSNGEDSPQQNEEPYRRKAYNKINNDQGLINDMTALGEPPVSSSQCLSIESNIRQSSIKCLEEPLDLDVGTGVDLESMDNESNLGIENGESKTETVGNKNSTSGLVSLHSTDSLFESEEKASTLLRYLRSCSHVTYV